ncbi:MAG: nitronate monooxygenase [Proteobacteria bacterium]|nr:nitronate monooxygenase [Pseudomonadota bacterium]
MNSLTTALCERLGIQLPIFGFSHSIEVTVALAEAGGFPVFGAARETPDKISEDIALIKQRLGGRPFGVDLMYPKLAGDESSREEAKRKLPAEHLAFVAKLKDKYAIPAAVKPNFFADQIRNQAFFDAQTEAVLESGVDAVVTAVGLPRQVVAAAKARGKTTFAMVGSARHVKAARDAGIDILVAQGYDAGGHTGPVGTYTLVPQVVEASGGLPVLAAGGVGHGRQVAAAFALGAQGVWLGTAWLATREYGTPPVLLRKILAARSEDTVITRAHSGKPCRVVKSSWSDEWDAAGAPKPLPMPYQHVLTGELLAAIEEHQVEPLVYEAAGQSVAWFNELTTVREIVARLVSETEAALDEMNGNLKAHNP